MFRQFYGECYAVGSEVPDIFALYSHWSGRLQIPKTQKPPKRPKPNVTPVY